MTDLVATTALGEFVPREQAIGQLVLSENASVALASLSLPMGVTRPAPFDIDLPGPGAWSAAGAVSAFWIGDGQWIFESPETRPCALSETLKSAVPGCPVTEQTDGYVVFEIRSQAGRRLISDVIERLANLDARKFTIGSAIRISIAHMTVFLIRRDAGEMKIIGMRSMAASLWHELTTAAEHIRATSSNLAGSKGQTQ